jgi:hypothetical protein
MFGIVVHVEALPAKAFTSACMGKMITTISVPGQLLSSIPDKETGK